MKPFIRFSLFQCTLFVFLSLVTFSCGDDLSDIRKDFREEPANYQPFVKEGKLWYYDDGGRQQKCKIEGDTIIQGQVWKKMLKAFSDFHEYDCFSEFSYVAAVREDNMRVYYILKGEKDPKFLFDLGIKVNESFKYLDDTYTKDSEDFVQTAKNVFRRYHCFTTLSPYSWGAEEVLEGIGSMTHIPWAVSPLDSCIEDGVRIFDSEFLRNCPVSEIDAHGFPR